SAQVLHRNLPIRLLFCIQQFLKLPFIVGCNPHFKHVHRTYLRAHENINSFGKIVNEQKEAEYVELLNGFIDDHMNVVAQLAQGVRDCKLHKKAETDVLDSFMNNIINERIGLRLLIEHQVSLHLNREHHAGVINKCMSPAKVVDKMVATASRVCLETYGSVPEVVVQGQTDITVPFVQAHLEYILLELFKNAFRASMEFGDWLDPPEVVVTISESRNHFQIRVSDRGGGFSPEVGTNMWSWSFTTVDEKEPLDYGLGATSVDASVKLAGAPSLGVGIPMSQAYANYFGGSLEIHSLENYGADAYLKLPSKAAHLVARTHDHAAQGTPFAHACFPSGLDAQS
ncbi:uncharacterized protein MONBRDRAFT_15226, partial [Monosiga brevicollis MX1]